MLALSSKLTLVSACFNTLKMRQFAAMQGLRLYEVNLENHPEMEAVFAKRDLKQIIHALKAICERQFEFAWAALSFVCSCSGDRVQKRVRRL